MEKHLKDIPVNTMPAGIREGIFIARATIDGLPDTEEVERSHRDNGHLFILQEKGTTHIEIDFQQHSLRAPALIYIHPSQVHRLIRFDDATTSSWIITPENLQPEYLKLLEDLAPVNALALDAGTLSVISHTAALCIELSERTQEHLYNYILRESCNTLVVLVASQYAAPSKTAERATRFGVVTRAFRAALEQDFTTVKSPAAYAMRLNISTPYLNECVKAATGQSVSHHIQQRVILEAKRLLYHSGKSIKEIAGGLGYDDYAYFSRLFRRIAGMTPLAFRRKNRD